MQNIKVWTNDRYKAPLHRVSANSSNERFSAPFFYNPSYSTDVNALNLSSSQKSVYKTINWGHFRTQRFAGDYANYGEEIQISQFKI
jgi:isopenicillin N synthase-like dioxygenase